MDKINQITIEFKCFGHPKDAEDVIFILKAVRRINIAHGQKAASVLITWRKKML